MRVRALSRPAFATGFELAGVPVTRAEDGRTAVEVIRRWTADSEVGVVLVDEALYRAIPRDTLARFERQALPLIVPVSAPRWDDRSDAEAYVLEILRQAIGYRVRPR